MARERLPSWEPTANLRTPGFMEAAPVFQTQEERLMVDAKSQRLRIGIPLESTWAENRVALTPEGGALAGRPRPRGRA